MSLILCYTPISSSCTPILCEAVLNLTSWHWKLTWRRHQRRQTIRSRNTPSHKITYHETGVFVSLQQAHKTTPPLLVAACPIIAYGCFGGGWGGDRGAKTFVRFEHYAGLTLAKLSASQTKFGRRDTHFFMVAGEVAVGVNAPRLAATWKRSLPVVVMSTSWQH